MEIEGGVWSRGRHVRGSGFEKDCEKHNEAAALGWSVFRFTGGMLESNLYDCIKMVCDKLDERALPFADAPERSDIDKVIEA